MYIIKIEPLEESYHPYQGQSHRTECWEEGYIAVPEELVPEVEACYGHCDLDIQDGVLVDVTPVPLPPMPEPGPTEMELAQQDITDLQLNDIEQGQAITDLELMLLGGDSNV